MVPANRLLVAVGAVLVLQHLVHATGCNRTIRTSFMILSSPRKLGVGESCLWRLVAHGGPNEQQVFELHFKQLQVGGLLNGTCTGARLRVATTLQELRTAGHYCGSAPRDGPSILLLRHARELYLELQRDLRPAHFTTQVSVLPKLLSDQRHPRGSSGQQVSRCDHLLSDCRPCTLVSPGYPGIYPRNNTCRYQIFLQGSVVLGGQPSDKLDISGSPCSCTTRGTSPSARNNCSMHSGRTLRTSMTLKMGKKYCPMDHVSVYEGQPERKVLIGRFCGAGDFPMIITRTRRAVVEFVAAPSGSMLHTGFIATVKSADMYSSRVGEHLPDSGKCEWKLTEESGSIYSLRHWHPPNTICKYTISAIIAGKVVVQFIRLQVKNKLSFTTEESDHNSCEYSSITLYDASIPHRKSYIGKYCVSRSSDNLHRNIPKTFRSTGRDLLIVYHTSKGSFDGNDVTYVIRYRLQLDFDIANPNYTFKSTKYIATRSCESCVGETHIKTLNVVFSFLVGLGAISLIGALATLSVVVWTYRKRRTNGVIL